MDSKEDGSKKKGPDGLSKKERRALKVAATDGGRNSNKVVINQQLSEKVKSMVIVNRVALDVKSDPGNLHICGIEPKSEDGLSKKERRALKVAASGKSTNEPVKSEKVEIVEKKDLVKPEKSEGGKDGGVSKAELRAQRRAVQEAQRLAKLNTEKNTEKVVGTKVEEKSKLVSAQPIAAATTTKTTVKKIPARNIQLFSHLNFKTMDINDVQFNFDEIHPEFYYLGSCYASKTVVGSNARCLKMLHSIKVLIEDFDTPPNEEFSRAFRSKLKRCIDYLRQCRPLAFAMSNVIQKIHIFLNEKLDVTLSEFEQKAQVMNFVTNYTNEEFEKAGQSISFHVTSKMLHEEVILVYGHSTVVVKTLMDAHTQNKNFKVIVIDCGPFYEGRKTLVKLESIGISCDYVHITRTASVITPVTKVLLGASALFGNGCIMSRTGTANVALIARIHNKSIIFCLESHKYVDAIQADSFVHNEIDESSYRQEYKNINYLNVMYDVTLPSLYDKFVTEIGSFHSLNAPHLMRYKALRAKKAA